MRPSVTHKQCLLWTPMSLPLFPSASVDHSSHSDWSPSLSDLQHWGGVTSHQTLAAATWACMQCMWQDARWANCICDGKKCVCVCVKSMCMLCGQSDHGITWAPSSSLRKVGGVPDETSGKHRERTDGCHSIFIHHYLIHIFLHALGEGCVRVCICMHESIPLIHGRNVSGGPNQWLGDIHIFMIDSLHYWAFRFV